MLFSDQVEDLSAQVRSCIRAPLQSTDSPPKMSSSVASTSRNVLRQAAASSGVGACSTCSSAIRSTRAASKAAAAARSFSSSSRTALDHVPPRNVFPPVSVGVGPLGINRMKEHYRNTLATDLLYMTYEHTSAEEIAAEEAKRQEKHTREWDPSDPYSKNRPARPLRGNRRPQPGPTQLLEEDPARNLVKLERVNLTCFVKDAIVNKHLLVPVVAQFRAITGLPVIGSNANPTALTERSAKQGYIKILRAKSGVASFKLRKGMPIGVQASLPGPLAHQFMDTLVTFVLPRLRSFNGFLLPPPNQPPASPAALSGVVSLGMGPEALPLFPQLEINWDAYPGKSYGFQVSKGHASILRWQG